MAEKALESLSLPGLSDTYVNTPLSTAPTFVTTQNYAVDDCVFYNKKLYKFITAHTAGAWDNSHVTEITVSGEMAQLKSDLSDLSDAVDDKYEKPPTGIPASDIASGVIPDVPVQDVQVKGTSILNQGVANIPKASSSILGVVKGGTTGIGINNDGQLFLSSASEGFIKSGTNSSAPIAPNNQHISAFYGLAKAAGDTTQSSSSNTVGTYTEEAKKAICNMIGVKYEEPFRLIKEIEITEETGKIVITTDNSNTPFVLSEIIILFKDMTANGSGAGGIGINTEIWSGAYLATEGTYHTSARTTVAHLEVKGGRLFGNSGYGFSQTYSRVTTATSKNASGIIPCDLIQKITIASLNNYSFTGGIITIYGR